MVFPAAPDRPRSDIFLARGGGRSLLRFCPGFCLAAVLAVVVIAPAAADEVATRHRGLTLNANLELAAGKRLEDGVAIVVHGTLAHNRMELIAALQRLLKARGVSTLAINLSLGIDDRHGFFDCGRLNTHRPGDAVDEIGAWLDWLKAQGVVDIALVGHSQGGNQVALFMVERRDSGVSAVIMLAPATYDAERTQATYRRRFEAELAPLLVRAQAMVTQGQGEKWIEGAGFLTCENATATATSFAAWYTPSPLRHTPNLLPRIKRPTLVVVAGGDEIVPDLAEALRPLDGKGEIAVRTIDGADHFFLDLYVDEAADAIAKFLDR